MPVDTEALAAALAAAALEPRDVAGGGEGRGVVICAGGARMFTCAWVCIGILRRHLGCTLPIEVWHIGPQEMGPPMRSLLEAAGVRVVDALAVARRHPVHRLGGWELKTYALLHSRFREVLLLDADNVPVRDPSGLFDRPEFQETGAIFWPDSMRLSRENRIWSIAHLPPYDGPSFESGQVLLDRRRCLRALALANWMNQRSDAFYEFLQGDKDTFLIAWLLLNQPFHLIQHPPRLLQSTICQRDPDGGILFQHRYLAKWVLEGVNPRVEGFRHEAACLDLLTELAGVWDGRVFNPPPRSEQARAAELKLARMRQFRFVCVSSEERPMELLRDHRIGAGAKGREFYWYVADGVDGLELLLEGGGHRSCALRRCEDGAWCGRLRYSPHTPVVLIPLDPSAAAADPGAAAERAALASLLDRALAASAALPGDGAAVHDFTGFVRTLSLLDPAIAACLRAEIAGLPAADPRAALLHAALDSLHGSALQPQDQEIARGHDWNTLRFPHAGYQPDGETG